MKINYPRLTTSIVAAILMVVATTSNAARIYNMTNVAVQVDGTVLPVDIDALPGAGLLNTALSGDRVALNAGEKSKSIEFTASSGVLVRDTDDNGICFVDWSIFERQLQGAHYFVIEQDKQKVVCRLCSSKHKTKEKAEGLMPKGSEDFVAAHQTCK